MSPNIYYLDSQDVIKINKKVTGGRNLLRDAAALDGALHRPKMASHYEQADLARQTALLIEGIVRNHPFLDGNKRTALVAAITFLRANSATISCDRKELALLIEELIIHREIDHFTTWVRTHLAPWS